MLLEKLELAMKLRNISCIGLKALYHLLECRGKLGLFSRRTVGIVNVSVTVSLERQRTTVLQVRNGERDKDTFKESSEIIDYVTSDGGRDGGEPGLYDDG